MTTIGYECSLDKYSLKQAKAIINSMRADDGLPAIHKLDERFYIIKSRNVLYNNIIDPPLSADMKLLSDRMDKLNKRHVIKLKLKRIFMGWMG